MTILRPLLIQELLLALCFVSVASQTECLAQESSPDLADATLEQLGNIKVYTASKHLQSSGDAPSSVTVVTADEIQRYGFRTLADVLQTVRGFFVTDDRNYSSVGVRGFARPGDYNTRVLLLVDGHRLNDNIYDEAMLGTEFPLDIDLIERVEIIRGPVSSLYGSNAFFAVINVVTRKGQDLKGLEVAGEAGSFNSYEGRVTYGDRRAGLEYLISTSFYGSRGHNRLFFPQFDTPETNHGIATHLDDDQVGSALITLSSHDFTLQAVYGTREKGIPTGAYGTLFNVPGTRTTDSHGYVDLKYEHMFAGSWEVLARAFYDRYSYEGTYMYAAPENFTGVAPNFDFADGKWLGTDLQVTKTLFPRNRVTFGGEYRDNIRQNQSNYSLNPLTLQMDDRRRSFVGAIYAQDEITITKSLALNAGFRHDYYNQLQSSVDPRAALIYRPRSHTALKFIYAEAFRVPNVYELYYSVTPNLANPRLHPEKISNTEVVWEQGITPHFWVTTSGFYNSITNLITEVPTPGGLLVFDNVQDVKSAGGELELKAELPHGLEGTTSYSFQQTKDKETHQFLSDSPRHLAKLNLSQFFFRRKMAFSLDAQYRSGMQSLDSGPVSSFSVLNATLLGRNLGKHLDLSASIYNLLDKTYFDPPSSANLQMPIQQDGRSFRVKLTWHTRER